MKFNFRFSRDGKRRLLKKKIQDQSKETPFRLYVSIKIHGHSRSKTMINWLQFCAGISISCNRLLDITRDLANRALHQYKSGGVFVPWKLKKKIFSIKPKDNINHNARSTTAIKHYHGTSFSVFQFPSVAFQVIWFFILMSFLQPLNRVIQKKLIPFSHQTQKFEDSLHHLLNYIFNSSDPSHTWFWHCCSPARSKGEVWMVRKCIWQ